MSSAETPDPFARSHRLALVALFLSGAAGLVHEVVWAKLLARLIGSTAHAQALVLALFMGGLAIGAVRYGRRSLSGAAGLRLYGKLEVLVGGYGLVLPLLTFLAAMVHDAVAPLVFGLPALALALRFLLASAIALLPAIWMGGTLPVLAACLTRTAGETRRRVGGLYSVNNLGAVVGSLVAGFVLLAAFGTFGSLVVAALLNFVSAAIGYRLARRFSASPGEPLAAEESPPARAALEPEAVTPRQARIALVVLALSGYAAMGYEAVVSRIISLAFGGTTYSFTVMLAAFITGIGLGSALISTVRVRRTLELLGLLQIGVAAAFLAITPAFARLPYWTGLLRIEMHQADFGFALYQLGKAGLCLLVLLVPTMCLGAGFPLVAALQVRTVEAVGSSVGRVYAWNTGGNVLGVLVTGLAVLPAFGLGAAFGSCVAVSLASGSLALAAAAGSPVRRAAGVAAGLLVLALHLAFGGGWLEPLQLSVDHLRMREHRQKVSDWGRSPSSSFDAWKEVYVKDPSKAVHSYFAEDANATVLALGNEESALLAVNTKPDASAMLVGSDMTTQILIAHAPALLSEHRRSALVIGYGSGATTGAILQHPFERVDVVEISPAVIGAHGVFVPFNHDALADPRVSVFVDDGRSFLRTVPRRYDLISSEPSNPWLSGIGALFTREYFQDARDRLNPGGVFCAWMHQYEMSEEGVVLVLRTLAEVFPSVSVHRASASGSDVMLICRNEIEPPDFERMEARFDEPAVWQDLQRVGALNLASLLAIEAIAPDRLRRLLPAGPLNHEFHERLEYAAPKAVFLGERTNWLARHDSLLRAPFETTHATIDAYLAWRRAAGDPIGRAEMEVAVAFAGEDLGAADPILLALRRLASDQPVREDTGAARAPARRALPSPESLSFELAFQTAARYHLLGDGERAWPYYQRAFDLRPDDPNVCWNLAKVLNAANRRAEAAEVLERGLRARPDSVELARDLAVTWVGLGREADALELLEELTSRAPDPTALTMLGSLRQISGRLEAAAALYQRALVQSRDSYWPAADKLARLLIAGGRREEASSLLRRALGATPGQENLLALSEELEASSGQAQR